MVALRLAPPFDVTDTVAVPEPVFVPLTAAHDVPDDELQLHVLDVVTVTLLALAPDVKLSAVGETE